MLSIIVIIIVISMFTKIYDEVFYYPHITNEETEAQRGWCLPYLLLRIIWVVNNIKDIKAFLKHESQYKQKELRDYLSSREQRTITLAGTC